MHKWRSLSLPVRWSTISLTILTIGVLAVSACNVTVTIPPDLSPTVTVTTTTGQTNVPGNLTPTVSGDTNPTMTPIDTNLPTVTPGPHPTVAPGNTPEKPAPTATATNAAQPTPTQGEPTATATNVVAQPTANATNTPASQPAAARPLLYVVNNNIHLLSPDKQDKELTNNNKDNLPMWSPDGSLFLFSDTAFLSPDVPGNIYVANADGTNIKLVAGDVPNGLTGATQFGWSSDGKIIYLEDLQGTDTNPFGKQTAGQPLRVVAIDPANGKKEVQGYVNYLGGCGGGESPARTEANGGYGGAISNIFRLNGLATFVTTGCNQEASVITPANKNIDASKQTDTAIHYTKAVPSPDYTQALAIASQGKTGLRDSLLAFFDGSGTQTRLLDLKMPIEAAAWSPNSDWIYYSAMDNNNNGNKGVGLDQGASIWRIHPDGTEQTKIYSNKSYGFLHLTVATDLSVAFAQLDSADKSGSHSSIYLLSPDGRKETLIVKQGGQPSFPTQHQ